jgi:valyl-tRNA synthetase
VLDTWFSSALWTFSTLGWPEDTERSAHLLPDQRAGHRLRHHLLLGRPDDHDDPAPRGEVPFREVYVHGLVRDAEGRRCPSPRATCSTPSISSTASSSNRWSTSAPAGLMQPQLAEKIAKQTRASSRTASRLRHRCAALHLRSLATTGRDIKFDLGRIEGYRNFCNKIWNAARYVLMNCEGEDCGQDRRAGASLAPRSAGSRAPCRNARRASRRPR